MQLEDVLYEVSDHVATITINRPDQYNAFRGQTCEDLIRAFGTAGYDKDVGAIVLTGVALLRRNRIEPASRCFRELPEQKLSPLTTALMYRLGEGLASVKGEVGDMLARRKGNSDGRVYTLTYESQDAVGNVGTCDATIIVPHDAGNS